MRNGYYAVLDPRPTAEQVNLRLARAVAHLCVRVGRHASKHETLKIPGNADSACMD